MANQSLPPPQPPTREEGKVGERVNRWMWDLWDWLKKRVPPKGAAPVDAQYVMVALDGTLTNERKLTAGSNITLVDGGANGNITIAATTAAPISAQYVVLALDSTLTAERRLVAGSNITIVDGGANGDVTISAAAGGSALTAKDEGSTLDTAVTSFDFVGAGVTATNVGHAVTVTIAGGSASPLTTKGDLYTHDATVDARLAVGSNDKPLVADSSTSTGLAWKTLPVAGGGTGLATLTAYAVVLGNGTGNVAFAAPGTSGYVLTSNGAAANPTFQAIPTVGTLQSQEFTSSGTFNVPAGVSLVWVTMVGAGGGGSTTVVAGTGGGAGGAGELVENHPVPVTASGTVTVTIGAKGTGGASGQGSAQVGVAGGDTSFGSTFVARGGLGGATNGASGAGGGVNGGTSTAAGSAAVGKVGTAEAPTYFGGGSGGAGGSSTVANGGTGGGSGGYTGAAGGAAGGAQAGGGGGASTVWGQGGAGGAGGVAGTSAASTSYGSGGGGSGGKATTTLGGGNGTDGYCLVQWVA